MRDAVRRLVPTTVKRTVRGGMSRLPLLLEPIDYLGRLVTGKADLPPRRLRKVSGSLRGFETSSADAIAYLKATCGLRPGQRMLDIGCGCGGTAIQLLDSFTGNGGYVGVDIDPPSIMWAKRNLTRRDSRFEFELLDVRNPAYYSQATQSAATFRFPFPDRSFDIVIAKSLFTHMRPDELSNYVHEISRLLIDSGHCLMTFFLLSSFREELMLRGASPTFKHGEGVWRYQDEHLPEAAIAYEEAHVRGLLSTNGFHVEKIIYGHQDVVIAAKAPPDHEMPPKGSSSLKGKRAARLGESDQAPQ